MARLRLAPEWLTTRWFNTDRPLSVAALRGKVIVVEAFQMLCRGCVERGLPQVQRVHELFRGAPLQVVGLHTVFEHHAAMTPTALEAFLHEYRITFPVGVDQPSDEPGGIPKTMERYAMQGTPTLLLIDEQGRLRRQAFGVHDDLLLGAEIATLLHEAASAATGPAQAEETAATPGGTRSPAAAAATLPAGEPGCDETGCPIDDE